MLEGGIADKLGNSYEARWTLLEALRVLRGSANEIRLEPYNEDSKGLEFRLTSDKGDEWHQCKRRLTNGSWSIKALTEKSVLESFAKKLSEPNTECVFVSSDPVPNLKTLIEKARIAETEEDFFGDNGLGVSDYASLKDLRAAWPVDDKTLLDRLKRCRIEVVSDTSLLRHLETICEILFSTPSKTVISTLVDFLNNNIAKRLTTEVLKKEIVNIGLKTWSQLDETLDEKFKAATDEYKSSLSDKIAGEIIPVEHYTYAVNTALFNDAQVTIVSGRAGSGKSLLLSEIICQAEKLNWPILAFRIDRYLDIQSIEDLGKSLVAFEKSPLLIFGNKYAQQNSLLVIDQIDAVSDSSGRSGRIRDLLFKMLAQSKYFGQMRIVVACRSYDLERDSRFKELAESKDSNTIELAPLDWDTAIMPLLKNLGVDEKSLTEKSKEVLSIPINLQIFAKILQSGESYAGELSGSLLFDKLIDIREKDIRKENHNWSINEALGAIAQNMSDNQELTAPSAVLDRFSGALDALSSMGLITAIKNKIQFSHESFFDHTFSRHFVTTGNSVLGLLTSDEQRLFRRTQVRQIFSRLREMNTRQYLINLRDVLLSDQIRYLVKDAIAHWLSEVNEPTSKELNIVEELFSTAQSHKNLAKIVFNGRGWLPLLIENNIINQNLDKGGENKEFAFWLLKKSASKYPDLIKNCLENWLVKNLQTGHVELINWFEHFFPDGDIGSLETLYEKCIDSLPSAYFKEDFELNFDLGSWAHSNHELAARIFGFWLRAWMKAFPASNPFLDDRKNNHSYWIQSIAEKNPEAFLEQIVPNFAEAIRRDQNALEKGAINYATIRPPHYEHDQEYFRQVIVALEKLAVIKPALSIQYLRMLGSTSEAGVFVQLKVILANPAELKNLLIPLLSFDRIFEVGDGDGDWEPLAKAASATFEYLGKSEQSLIEELVLNYRPEFEWAVYALRKSKTEDLLTPNRNTNKYIMHELAATGRKQRAILSTIGLSKLSIKARRRLEELDRKFFGEAFPRAYGIRGGFVRSPISSEIARKMSDRQWLSAIEKYNNDNSRSFEVDGVIGGARELSLMLQNRTKEDPERFVKFMDKLPINCMHHYPEAILSGLREADVDAQLVIGAIHSSFRWDTTEFNRAICWAVQKHSAAGKDTRILAFLVTIAGEGQASDTAVTTVSSKNQKNENESANDLLQRRSDLVSSGINGERGSAYEALANVLWDNEEALPIITELLTRRVLLEPLTSVLMCMAHTINSVGKYNPETATKFLKQLFHRDLHVIQCHAISHMVGWVVNRNPELISEAAENLSSQEDLSLKAHGYFLQSLLALRDERFNESFTQRFKSNTLIRQIAAYRGAANLKDYHWTKTSKWLLEFFYDPDQIVRQETHHIHWEEILDNSTDKIEFARSFLLSPAFGEYSDGIMRSLEEKVSQYSELTFSAVSRVLELSPTWQGEQRKGHYTTLHRLNRFLVELYRCVEGEMDKESKILDLIDNNLSRDMIDIRAEISAYERH